jgi:hypothetical protein
MVQVGRPQERRRDHMGRHQPLRGRQGHRALLATPIPRRTSDARSGRQGFWGSGFRLRAQPPRSALVTRTSLPRLWGPQPVVSSRPRASRNASRPRAPHRWRELGLAAVCVQVCHAPAARQQRVHQKTRKAGLAGAFRAADHYHGRRVPVLRPLVCFVRHSGHRGLPIRRCCVERRRARGPHWARAKGRSHRRGGAAAAAAAGSAAARLRRGGVDDGSRVGGGRQPRGARGAGRGLQQQGAAGAGVGGEREGRRGWRGDVPATRGGRGQLNIVCIQVTQANDGCGCKVTGSFRTRPHATTKAARRWLGRGVPPAAAPRPHAAACGARGPRAGLGGGGAPLTRRRPGSRR